MKIDLSYFTGLRGKIQAVFLVIFTLAAAIFAGSVYITLKPDMQKRFEQELSGTTDIVAELTLVHIEATVRTHLDTVSHKFLDTANYYYGLSRKGVMRENEAYREFSRFMLDPKIGKIGDTGYMAGISSKGIAVIHPKIPGRNLSSHDFMKRAIEMKNGYLEYQWKNPGDDKERKKVGSLVYFEPWDVIIWASSYQEEFLRFVDLKNIQRIMEKVRIGNNGYALIMDSKGVILRNSGQNQESKIEDLSNTDYVQDIIRAATSDPKNSHVRVIPRGFREGEVTPYITGARYIEELDWIVITAIGVSETTKSISTIFNFVALIVASGILVIAILTGIIFTRLLQPVSEIKSLSEAVSSGDLTQRADIHTNDEIGQMAGQYNVIINNFASLIGDVKETSTMLQTSVQELSSSSQEIATTSNQQAAAVKEIVSTMEDSDSLSKSVAKKIEEVTRVSVDTKNIVDNGYTIIRGSLSQMEEIRKANADTIQGIKLLGERIDNIWEIVNIINGIADQTKIIAFNAELEASAAGEAGKNFQIVATEIRRLADNTVSSTNEIRTKINEIQHSSDQLIIASEEGTEKISQGLALSENLKEQFDDILRSAEISVTSAEQISVSIKQQVSAFEQILLTLKQISEGIDNFVISTRSMTASSEGLQNKSTHLNEVISRYRIETEESDG